jgi:NTP pyrophosphatase (non-canonical NTP hydrolase)
MAIMEHDPMATDLTSLIAALRQFSRERDWEQFHSPKNLACALAVEAGELLEHFQWLPDEKSRELPEQVISEVAAELADVFLYLLQLSDELGIDLVSAAEQKIVKNAQKYPIDRSRGSSKKYTQL